MDFREKVKAATDPLVGTTWYEVIRREFKMVKFGPLRVCTENDLPNDTQRFTSLTDGSGNIAWYPDIVDKKANKYSTMFFSKDEAIAYLRNLHETELRKYRSFVQYHETELAKLDY